MSPTAQPSERRVWARDATSRQTLRLSDQDTDEILWAARGGVD